MTRYHLTTTPHARNKLVQRRIAQLYALGPKWFSRRRPLLFLGTKSLDPLLGRGQ